MSMKLEHLNYVYSPGTAYEKKALNDICLEIPDVEFIGIIGHTGSGKSTLIQHLNGLLKATSGELYFNGENIYSEGYNMRELRNQVGLVFQYPEHQLFEVDVMTDVCFGPKNQGLTPEECEKRALEALKLVGLKEKYYRSSPFELSGGQMQRVALASVIVLEPDILIIDEPTSQLDPEGTESVFAIIKAMKDKQKTIILVEHKIDLIAEYADDVLVLKDGELIAVGDKNEILTDITLMEKGVALPQVVLLAVKLQKAGLPLTKIPVTEKQAIEMIGQAMKEKRG